MLYDISFIIFTTEIKNAIFSIHITFEIVIKAKIGKCFNIFAYSYKMGRVSLYS